MLLTRFWKLCCSEARAELLVLAPAVADEPAVLEPVPSTLSMRSCSAAFI